MSGAKGDTGEGFCNAWTMSWRPFRIKLLEDDLGIGMMVGSQVKVSQMCVDRDSHNHMV